MSLIELPTVVPARSKRRVGAAAGFTLIEVIVSITIFTVMGAMLFLFLSSSMVRSYQPLAMTAELARFQHEMEAAVAAYNNCLFNGYSPTCWAAFKTEHGCGELAPAEDAAFGDREFAICKVAVPPGQPVLVGYFTFAAL